MYPQINTPPSPKPCIFKMLRTPVSIIDSFRRKTQLVKP